MTNNQTKTFEKGAIRLLPLTDIALSTTNPRKSIDPEALRGLAESIKQHGVLQAILVRPNPRAEQNEKKYEIIFGERRFRGAKLAKRAEIPARVVVMTDEQVLQIQIIENLQRVEIHPLDEAEGFAHLKERSGYTISEIAQRVAKEERYIARRLALTSLTPEAKEDYRQERITLSHALELCRLAPEIQTEALASCYEYTNVYDKDAGTWVRRPDKERPARHVRYLQEWIRENVHLNLAKAPFKTDDIRLREDGLICLECPQRSGFNKGLFSDIGNDSTCLNPPCFKAKLETFVQIKRTEIEAKTGQAPVYISTRYGSDPEKNIIGSYEYVVIERRGTRCEYAEAAIYMDGEEVGRVKWICRERSCKDHLNRAHDAYSRPVGTNRNASNTDDANAVCKQRNARKQELFDLKVDEAVRKRVFAESLKTYGWPLERKDLNVVAKEFFRRISSDDQKTIAEVFGFDKAQADSFRHEAEALLEELANLDEARLAGFMMLCSFAHYGANPGMHKQYDQTRVTQLAAERGVNHTLIDAEVRAVLSPKKYKARHESYLDAVKRGVNRNKPVVFEQMSRTADVSTETKPEEETVEAAIEVTTIQQRAA